MFRETMRNIALAALLAILCVDASMAADAPSRKLPWGGSALTLELPFRSDCARIPVRFLVSGELEIATNDPLYLGDPVAYGIGRAVEGFRRNRSQRAGEKVAWPDVDEMAHALRAELVRGIVESAVLPPMGDETTRYDACKDTLYVQARPVIRVDLTGIAIEVNTLLVREGVKKPLYRDRIEVDSPTRELSATRSKREREALLAAMPGDAVSALASQAFRWAGDALAYDLSQGATEPRSRTRQRYRVAAEAVTSSALVLRKEDVIYLRARASRLIVRPNWAKPA